ncbi:DNA-binding protein BIN4-like isoform X1 [Raphanus sativus]|uniref:DNA-binding protein BIN4-like isoform X1 n=2 Tax=Raphanus sativus TaxID=3726 RepID=A0A9W3CG06_RAPSA|nr:DNA-binding protein BIN4-like isoform X1 [Raphanus sativus]XP_056850541.1 DNA-binding protein BIN4-like isoform X1 [Raphanus sativus]
MSSSSSSSREGSPDWLRSFQTPTTTSLLSLSSSSESAPDDSPYKESETISSLPLTDDSEATTALDSETKLVTDQVSVHQVFSRKKKADATLKLEEKQKGIKVSVEGSTKQGGDDSVWLVSSDSEPPSSDPIREQVIISTEEDEKDEDLVILEQEEEPAVKKAPKKKSPKKKPNSGRQILKQENIAQEISEDKDTDSIVAEEVTTDKNTKPSSSGSSSRLPLVLSEKVNRTKVLVECEGDSIDLSGDMGAVGRVVVSDTTEDMFFDLKGTIYKSTIVPSRTFCVVRFFSDFIPISNFKVTCIIQVLTPEILQFQVNVGQSEAKIEAIMNDFVQLTPVSNVYEAETMVEGTLEGFLFDSDDEGNKNAKTASKPADDQRGDTAEITKGSGKAKEKSENVVVGKKRGRPTKEKQQQQQPAKKARSCASKKTKPKR